MSHPINQKYFFITNYDDISSALIAFMLNSHPDIDCSMNKCDGLLPACQRMNLTVDKWIHHHRSHQKILNGNINQFSTYELQNKILLEKSKHPLRMINLIASPHLRVKLLLQSWITAYKTPEMALDKIETQFLKLHTAEHDIIQRYRLGEVLMKIQASLVRQQVDLSLPVNKLFIFALAKTIVQDSADLPSSCKKILLENLLTDESYFIDFIQTISNSCINMTPEFRMTLKQQIERSTAWLTTLNQEPCARWMTDITTEYMNLRLKTIYYPHVDKPLISLYHEHGYTFTASEQSTPATYSKLLSIQLNSNRPAQLSIYFDNIEETADFPEKIEVLVNIDHDDIAMHEMLEREIPQRKFTLKYIMTPRPRSFCDLWKPINNLLAITDANAYFLLNISDEMLFATQGWDSILEKYVGYFPDHIFRLRASRNKFRNYFDRWECSFAQDSIPITTKKWVDIGGDWNPCFGPDSFQQLISFYLAKEGAFSSSNHLRELPVIDIKFHGDIPALGIHPLKAWKHNRDHLLAMQICQSHPMQLEARRRAILLKAHIIATHCQINDFHIVDDKPKKQINLINSNTGQMIANMDYNLSWLIITFTNQIRKFRFYYYFGAGKEYEKGFITGFASYLKSKYSLFRKMHTLLCKLRMLVLHKPSTILPKTGDRIKSFFKNLLPNKPATLIQLEKLENEIQTLQNMIQIISSENEHLKNLQLNPFVQDEK